MENNFALTGNEARILMGALMTSTVSAPLKDGFSLYQRLSEISQVQPPVSVAPAILPSIPTSTDEEGPF